jgi:hypothetical protein
MGFQAQDAQSCPAPFFYQAKINFRALEAVRKCYFEAFLTNFSIFLLKPIDN